MRITFIIMAVCFAMCGNAFSEAIVIELPDSASMPWDTIAEWPPLEDGSITDDVGPLPAPPAAPIVIGLPDSASVPWDTIAEWPPLEDGSVVAGAAGGGIIPPVSDEPDGVTDLTRLLQGARQATGENIYIAAIEVHGNKTTRPEVLELFFRFKVGDTLDLEALRASRAELLRTQLYRKADIFPHIREDGAHIFVVLEEAVRLQLGYGVSYFTSKHGCPDLWYYVSGDAVLYNFRGRLEDIAFGGSFWDNKTLYAGWRKPFLSTPYYMSTDVGISQYPDEALPVDFTDVFGQLSVGRSLTQNTRLSVGGMPIYRHRAKISRADPELYDRISTPERDNFYEAFGLVNLITDKRRVRFDPQSGWMNSAELRTNHLYPGVNTAFFQFRNETRYYLPLLFDDFAVLRSVFTLRDVDAGAYHRLTYGSTGTLRGYYEQALGWNFISNSSILLSLKYHKPIWESPPMPMPIFNLIYKDIKETQYRVDAALIVDYARLYEKPFGAVTQNGRVQDGVGLGGGIRILIPDIRQSGCIDLVYGRREKETGGFEWKPMLHAYLDLFY